MPIWRKAFNFVGFQLGWFACVLGASYGYFWLGPCVVALLALAHLGLGPKAAGEIRIAGIAAILGLLFDSALSGTGLLVFAGTYSTWLSPPWMVALWVNFALTLRFSLSWLLGRPLLGAGAGMLFGPLAYLAGSRLGAVELSTPTWVPTAVLAGAWGVAIPFLLWVAAREDRSC